MKTKFQASTVIRPICLENVIQVDSTDAVLVLGWGMDRHGEHGMELNIAKLHILDPDYCKEVVETVTGFGDDLLCAIDQALGGSGSCFGDSGGPVFAFNSIQRRYELKGLVSGGAVPGQCGAFGAPDIFTRTSFDNIYRWISKKTEDKSRVQNKGEEGEQSKSDEEDDSYHPNPQKDDCEKKFTSERLRALFCKT